MAIANSDGSIILSTKVDTSGINKGMSQMEGKAAGLTKTFSKLGAAIASAFAIQKIIQFSNETGQLATQTEASVQRLVDIYGSASDVVGNFIDANARALGMSKAAAASFSSVYGNLFSVWADQATNAELTNRYLNMTAVVASKTGRTVEDVQERIRSGLLGNTEAIEDLGIFVNVKTIEMTDAFQRMANGKSWEQLDAYTQQQIRSMAILEQATAKYGDEVANTSATARNRYKAAYEEFKNSWGNIVNTVLLPVLETLTQVFDVATRGLNAISGMTGGILQGIQIQEDSTDKTAENIEDQADAQKKLNSEMKKTLAGFDDIQILSAKTSEDAANNGEIGLGDMASPSASTSFSNEINKEIQAIMAVVGVSLVAVGLILLYKGQTSYGIGFIIAGAADVGVTAASFKSDLPNELWAFLSIMSGIISAAFIFIGLALIASQVGAGLGVGFLVAGASGLVSSISLNWNSVTSILNNMVDLWKKSILFGAGLVVIGILLMCTGHIEGLALILAGAGSLIYQVVAPNWDFLAEKVEEIWDKAVDVWNSKIQPGLDEVAAAWERLYYDHLKPVIDWIRTRLLEPLMQFLGSAFVWAMRGAVNVLVDLVKFGIDYAGDRISKFLNTITLVIKFIDVMADGIVWAVEKIKQGVDAISPLLDSFTGGLGINISGNVLPFKIPQLATGAVLPANKPFLAMVGDQKYGTNIEAPLETIVDAFNIALQNNANFGGGNTEVVLEIDGREFGRAVVQQGNRESRRIGTRMVIV